jgi:hypothetical protein
MIDDMDELKALIIAKLDVMEFLDLLGLDLSDLVGLLEEEIEEQYTRLDRACR